MPRATTSHYAERTTVDADRTRIEIERKLRDEGATAFAYATDDKTRRAIIEFEWRNRRVRFVLPLPDPNDRAFIFTSGATRRRTASAAKAEYEQALRSRWRALLIIIKAKIEAVKSGIVTLEDEFLAHIVLSDGTTIGDNVTPMLERIAQPDDLPLFLPAPRRREE